MTQWEYLIEQAALPFPIPAQTLAILGSHGWEMVSATLENPHAQPGETYPGIFLAVFKRARQTVEGVPNTTVWPHYPLGPASQPIDFTKSPVSRTLESIDNEGFALLPASLTDPC